MKFKKLLVLLPLLLAGCSYPTSSLSSSSSSFSSSSESSSSSSSSEDLPTISSVAFVDENALYFIGDVFDSVHEISVEATMSDNSTVVIPEGFTYEVKNSENTVIDTSIAFTEVDEYTIVVSFEGIASTALSFDVINNPESAIQDMLVSLGETPIFDATYYWDDASESFYFAFIFGNLSDTFTTEFVCSVLLTYIPGDFAVALEPFEDGVYYVAYATNSVVAIEILCYVYQGNKVVGQVSSYFIGA